MDTTDPQIIFDSDGNCNHCTEFISKRSKHQYQGAESDKALDLLVEQMKQAGKGMEYDCVMGLSGGVDSSYAAYIARQKGLRVLGVHMDNGWNSEEAVLNIKNVAGKLDIDYESYVLDWVEFRDVQLSFLKAAVPEAETPTDMAIPAAKHYFASKYKVKYVISGGNFATEGILPKYWHYNAKDLKYFNHIQKTFGTIKLKKFPTFGFMKEMYFKLFKGIRMVYLLNYIPYAKDEAKEFLLKELDWKDYGGKHHESKYTGFIHSYYLYTKFGIDYRRATLSTQICSGDISREDALKELSTIPYNPDKIEDDKKYIAKKLSISMEEFEKILSSPAKWYTAYPNDEKKLGFIYNTDRKVFKKEKLANF